MTCVFIGECWLWESTSWRWETDNWLGYVHSVRGVTHIHALYCMHTPSHVCMSFCPNDLTPEAEAACTEWEVEVQSPCHSGAGCRVKLVEQTTVCFSRDKDSECGCGCTSLYVEEKDNRSGKCLGKRQVSCCVCQEVQSDLLSLRTVFEMWSGCALKTFSGNYDLTFILIR